METSRRRYIGRMSKSQRRRILTCLLTGITVLLGAGTASAEFLSGNDLYDYCTSDKTDDVSATGCIGYVAGVADVLEDNPVNGFHACMPLSVSRVRARDTAVAFLTAHPEKRDRGADGLIAEALARAFPCK